MTVELADWEARLEAHFVELQRNRKTVSGNPVFALEHGLNSSEVQTLVSAVRNQSTKGPPSEEHALVWIVYATEIGYRYSGDEYWQTFEQETPAWDVYGDRYWIRDRFRWFQRRYGGAAPSGRWAEHFSIICWPITHAIVPQDLQHQLAHILYELRNLFSAEVFESPAALGKLIFDHSWKASSRFQNFAQETQLVGQISAALLQQETLGTGSLIHPRTLQRISEDLDRTRRAREWLRGARHSADERARIRGLATIREAPLSIIRRTEDARAEIQSLGIEPRLMLTPADFSGVSWKVWLEISDLSHLLLRFPETRTILTGSRCVVAGSSSRPLARGWCLHGPKRVLLSYWPDDDEVLLQFEQKHSQLDYLLRTECLLRPGPIWLFRVASDGLAYELRSLRVRSGERYIVLSKDERLKSCNLVCPIQIDCSGITAAMLDVPEGLTPEWEDTVRNLGLHQARTIEVWPAGLAAADWDGEGYGEWLVSEKPCLAICTDHAVDAIVVSTGNDPDLLELQSIVPGEPIFIELPQLGVGLHTVRLSARSAPNAVTEFLGELNVVMRIREARPWLPGVNRQGALIVEVDPPQPTLEQLWEGRVDVNLLGPKDRLVNCKVSLFESGMSDPSLTKQLPAIPLPVTPDGWRAHFTKHFCEKAQRSYDAARLCDLEFSADELGHFAFRCEREFTPLRWALRREGQNGIMRLINDSGVPSQLTVLYMAYESPCVEKRLEIASDYRVPAAGGIYVARLDQYVISAIAPPTLMGFGDLRLLPRIDQQDRSTDNVLRTLTIYHWWADARLPGDLISAKRLHDVLEALKRHIFRLIGGEYWGNCELKAVDADDKVPLLRKAVLSSDRERFLAEVLEQDGNDLAKVSCKQRVERLASIAGRHVVGKLPNSLWEWLTELALRLASDPMQVETWAGNRLRPGIASLLELRTLAKAARFLVILIDSQANKLKPERIHPDWRWE